MQKETLEYHSGDVRMKGHLVYDQSSDKKRPAVLVAHAWRGQDDFARNKAERLAKMGYIGFAVDVYGEGKTVESDEDAFATMSPLFVDRKTLRNRIVAAYQTIKEHQLVDQSKIGAIGFCFGGLTVIELYRSGVALRGVVSFHGVLGTTLGDLKAKVESPTSRRDGSILVLHGYHDPMVTQEDIVNFQTELSNAEVDWQMNVYGEASHAFTNPEANSPDGSLVYHQKSEQRALKAMENFFKEVFTG